MSLFSAILDKLGFGSKAQASEAAAPEVAAQAPAVIAISVVDVVAKMESLAASNARSDLKTKLFTSSSWWW